MRERPRARREDQPRLVNRTPWGTDPPGDRISGGATQTMVPSAPSGPWAVCRVRVSGVSGGKACGSRSNKPPRLISRVRPGREAPPCPLGSQVTGIWSGRRTPAGRTIPFDTISSQRACASAGAMWVKVTPCRTPPSPPRDFSPHQATCPSASMAPRSVRRHSQRRACGASGSANSRQAPRSLRFSVHATPGRVGAGVQGAWKTGS